MKGMKRLPVSLPEKHYELLKKLVEKGEFPSIAEAIRAAVRLLLEKYFRVI